MADANIRRAPMVQRAPPHRRGMAHGWVRRIANGARLGAPRAVKAAPRERAAIHDGSGWRTATHA